MDLVIIGIGGVLLSGSTFAYSLCTIIAGGIATGLITLNRTSWHHK